MPAASEHPQLEWNEQIRVSLFTELGKVFAGLSIHNVKVSTATSDGKVIDNAVSLVVKLPSLRRLSCGLNIPAGKSQPSEVGQYLADKLLTVYGFHRDGTLRREI